ncbi:unnamed protein product, partial [Linum tenue]
CPTDDSSLFQFVVGAHLQPPSFFHRGNLLAVPASPPFSILLLFPARESVSKRGVEGVPYLTLPSPSSNSLSRGLGFFFSLLASIVMASNNYDDWISFDGYEEYSLAHLLMMGTRVLVEREEKKKGSRKGMGIIEEGSAEGNLEARAGTMKISISMDATYRPQRLEKGITKHPGKCSLDSPFRIHYLGPCCFSLQEGRKEVRQTGCQ